MSDWRKITLLWVQTFLAKKMRNILILKDFSSLLCWTTDYTEIIPDNLQNYFNYLFLNIAAHEVFIKAALP